MPLHDDYQKYIAFMKKCWDAGLIDPDMFTQTEAQFLSKSVENIVGYAGNTSPFGMTAYQPTYMEYEQLRPLVENKGDTPVYWHQYLYGLGNMLITDASTSHIYPFAKR